MHPIETVTALMLLVLTVTGIVDLPAASASEIAVRLRDSAAVRDREAQEMAPQNVRADDGWFEGRVPASIRSERIGIDGEGRSVFALEIGASRLIECRIDRSPMDLPRSLRERSEVVISENPDVRALGRLEKRLPERIDSFAVGPVPAMGVEWFLVGEDSTGEKRMLGVHLLYAVKRGAGIGCVKVDVGFRRTFRRVFEALVEQFERSNAPADRVPTSIVRRSIDDFDVGLRITTVRTDSNGDHVIESVSHVVIPRPGGPLEVATSREVEAIEGRTLMLESQTRTLVRDGTKTADLRLEREGDGVGWRVRGRQEDESVDAALSAGGPIVSSLAFQHAVGEALAAEDPLERSFESWVWSTGDPKVASRVTTRITALIDADTARIARTEGTDIVESIVERATAQPISSALIKDGRVIMRDERIFAAPAP